MGKETVKKPGAWYTEIKLVLPGWGGPSEMWEAFINYSDSDSRMDTVLEVRGKVLRILYARVFKEIFFVMDPEHIHDIMIDVGEFLGKSKFLRAVTAALFRYRHPMLEQRLVGIDFPNPVGLSGGFDKNGRLTNILPSVGFGFLEIGSVTGEPCAGNAKPRMWRLKKSRSLLIHYGLNNDGAQVIARRLLRKQFSVPIGVNIAKTNSPDTVGKESGTADYLKAYRKMAAVGDYVTLNISCPNAFGGCPFTQSDYLEYLLERMMALPKTKPIFVKLSPDGTEAEIDAIVALARRFKIDGFVVSNLTKPRKNPRVVDQEVPELGGMSGKVVEDLSNTLLASLYQKVGKEMILIGVGGIFSAEDAYRKIRSGASLLQLITGMIFEGPQLIGAINQGLAKRLKQDGFAHISEAVGADVAPGPVRSAEEAGK